jgi:hypothetical protein
MSIICLRRNMLQKGRYSETESFMKVLNFREAPKSGRNIGLHFMIFPISPVQLGDF